MSEIVLEIKRLTRRFGAFTALDDLTISVNAGEVFGFLGSNGAGKTTTIKMLTTLLRPSSGEAQVAGFSITAQAVGVRHSIGYVRWRFPWTARSPGKRTFSSSPNSMTCRAVSSRLASARHWSSWPWPRSDRTGHSLFGSDSQHGEWEIDVLLQPGTAADCSKHRVADPSDDQHCRSVWLQRQYAGAWLGSRNS